MSVRADAHLHFFRPGFVATLPEDCRRVQPDEITLYEALARQHNVQQVLVVGYEGERWAAGNNQYLAELAVSRPWLKPVAFIDQPKELDISDLMRLHQARFVGISLYVFDDLMTTSLDQVSEAVWQWLVQHNWLVSVNSRGEYWLAWAAVLNRHPQLRLIVSHLGLPPPVEQAVTLVRARDMLRPVLSLAQYPATRVKLSGFYALTEPRYSYPHQAAWAYVEALLGEFGSNRLLWGSDFSPSLEWLSFPQTFGLFGAMPFFDEADLARIEGDNLTALLAEVADGSSDQE